MRLLLLSCLLLVVPAWAQSSLFLSGEALIDLKTGAEVVTGGDVLLQNGLLFAPFGVRRSGGGWATSEHVELGAKLEIRDMRGDSYEVAVQSVEENWVSLGISPIRKVPVRRDPRLGTFKATHWSINGVEATPTVPMLKLEPGGDYRFGGAKGQWSIDEGGVGLSGPYAHWGHARVRADGNELVFEYGRGSMRFEVVMTREPG